MDPVKKKRRTWLWILGWLCIFPLPLTILVLQRKDANKIGSIAVICAAWAAYFAIGLLGTKNYEETAKVVPETASYAELTPETGQTEGTEPAALLTEMETEAQAGDHYDESLVGRGNADTGREEPEYVGVIGYLAVSYDQEIAIKNTDDFQNEDLWKVPVYTRDKQFWEESGSLPHKTEVVVREQMLEHKGYGRYAGYLRVEKKEDGTQYYVNVSNFITRPYWTYQEDLKTAAMTGPFTAEYKQVSDYYPVDSGGDKLVIPDGTIVLVLGISGLSGRYDQNETDIEAVVWREWKNGYGGVTCHFNQKDLKIIY